MNWKNLLLVPAVALAIGCAEEQNPYIRIQNGVKMTVKLFRSYPPSVCYSDTATVDGMETQYCYSPGGDRIPEVRHEFFSGTMSIYDVLLESPEGRRLAQEGEDLKRRFSEKKK